MVSHHNVEKGPAGKEAYHQFQMGRMLIAVVVITALFVGVWLLQT